ncbi:uncharacterized protein LOC107980738 [Nasonia vitripennis]|uniref:Uncharacterized protein n=1 Tax=Nasonia vitripennis TaxID=7425 RepID=A0A7M7INM8_NASVI|nr:uncharacterized protein LOC107980738 [Nasonia vitripennis]
MMSKVLFLVLVGCAMVLAKPTVLREEVSNEVPNKSVEVEVPKESTEVEIVEVSEEELQEIIKNVEEKINEIFEKVNEGFNEGDFKKAFEEMQKIFGQKKPNEN